METQKDCLDSLRNHLFLVECALRHLGNLALREAEYQTFGRDFRKTQDKCQ